MASFEHHSTDSDLRMRIWSACRFRPRPKGHSAESCCIPTFLQTTTLILGQNTRASGRRNRNDAPSMKTISRNATVVNTVYGQWPLEQGFLKEIGHYHSQACQTDIRVGQSFIHIISGGGEDSSSRIPLAPNLKNVVPILYLLFPIL